MLITAEQVEERMESVQDYQDQLSSTSEEDGSSSVGTKTDGALIERVYYQVCIKW